MVDLIIRPVILRGGSGTRLWPFSRKAVTRPSPPLMTTRDGAQAVGKLPGAAGQ